MAASPSPIVGSVLDSFDWPWWYGAQVSASDASRVVKELQAFTYTTYFSGICAPSIAITSMALAFPQLQSIDTPPGRPATPTYLACCERDPACLVELDCLPHPPRCAYHDIIAFLTNKGRERLHKLGSEPSFDDLWRALVVCTDSVSLSAWCHCCNCRHDWPFAKLVVAGSPCIDFSSLGKLKREHGSTTTYLLIFAVHRFRLREHSVILENVELFKPKLLRRIFGQVFNIDTVVLNLSDFGAAARRKRRYSILTPRGDVLLKRPLTELVSFLGRQKGAQHSCHDYFMASDRELGLELQWAASRRSSNAVRLHTRGPGRALNVDDVLDGPDGPINAFRAALSTCEEEYLVEHINRYPGDRIFNLQNNPAIKGVHQISTLDGLWYCLVKSSYLHWNNKLSRWATARELLTVMGFPVYDECLARLQTPPWQAPRAELSPICSFNQPRIARGHGRRDRKQMGMQAGNTMAVLVIGAVILWTLLYVDAANDTDPNVVAVAAEPIVLDTPPLDVASITSASVPISVCDGSSLSTLASHKYDDDNDDDDDSFLAGVLARRKYVRCSVPRISRSKSSTPCGSSVSNISDGISDSVFSVGSSSESVPASAIYCANNSLFSSRLSLRNITNVSCDDDRGNSDSEFLSSVLRFHKKRRLL